MADREAKWVEGKSQLLQERPAQNVEWKWINGKSGDVAVEKYVSAGGFKPAWAIHHRRTIGGGTI